MAGRQRKCPGCGTTTNVVPIVYGMPSSELFEAAERGELQLAGCLVGGPDPPKFCKACRLEFDFERPELAETE